MRPKTNSRFIQNDHVAALMALGFSVAKRIGNNIVIMENDHIQVSPNIGGMYLYTLRTSLKRSVLANASDIEDLTKEFHRLKAMGAALNDKVRALARDIEQYFKANHVPHLLNCKSAGVYEFLSKGTSSVHLFTLRGMQDHWEEDTIQLSSNVHDGEEVKELDDVLRNFASWNKFSVGPAQHFEKRVVTLEDISCHIHSMIQRGVVDVVMQEYQLSLTCDNEMARPLVDELHVKAIVEKRRVYEIKFFH